MERVAVENMMRIKKLMALERGSGAMMASARALGTGTTGYLFSFPATLFLVQSYGLYVVDARGGKFITTRPTCYVSKHTMVYDEGE
jgi:hypothetical protein